MAIFLPKNKTKRKYVHLFRQKVKISIFWAPKKKTKFGRSLERILPEHTRFALKWHQKCHQAMTAYA